MWVSVGQQLKLCMITRSQRGENYLQTLQQTVKILLCRQSLREQNSSVRVKVHWASNSQRKVTDLERVLLGRGKRSEDDTTSDKL